jgi:hypothetical protein
MNAAYKLCQIANGDGIVGHMGSDNVGGKGDQVRFLIGLLLIGQNIYSLKVSHPLPPQAEIGSG